MRNSFTVSPMSQKIHLEPGETYQGSIMVANPAAATENFYYKVALYPYSVLGEEYDTDFETVSDWSRIVEWTTLENETGVLKPNGTQMVNFTIEVPKNAPGGGQYMMLGVSSNNSVDNTNNFAVQNVYEMASVVYADVEGETTHGGQILENQIPGFVATGAPYVLTRLTNTGNVHETAEVTITVKNSFNGEMIIPKDGENNTFESVVMPESTRLVKRTLANMPPLGVFEVTQNVSFMGDNINITSVMVICPIWFIFLVLATIGSVIGMVFYGRHLKRKKLEKVVDF